jgi:hypothetical protein
MTTNRIVLLLSPILLGLAGWVVMLAARYLPGHPKLNEPELYDAFRLGVGLATAKLLLWLHGWQKQEARQQTRSNT